ncbi:MAG: hypothetical protein LBN04_07595 [Oscillospiraceae bacterium]|jgi:hypothetical protein|nr:hypothetical protein [Oscillospiraceae bacterium]
MKKFLMILPLLLCVAFSVFFYSLFSEQERLFISQAMRHRTNMAALVEDAVEFINTHRQADGTERLYTEWVVHTVENVDRVHNTLGIVADADLNVLNARHYEGEQAGGAFDIEAERDLLLSAEEGTFERSYGDFSLLVNFRWVNATWDHQRYLLITGTSPQDVSGLGQVYVYGAVLLIGCTVVCNYILLARIRRYTPISPPAPCRGNRHA